MAIKYLGSQLVYPKPKPFTVPLWMTSDGAGFNSQKAAQDHEDKLPE